MVDITAMSENALSVSPQWAILLDADGDNIIQSVLGLSDFDAYILTAGGLYYTPNAKTTYPLLKAALTGATLVRATGGAAGGVSVLGVSGGNVIHSFSSTYGDSPNQVTVAASGGDTGGDVDDYNLGIVMAAANKRLHTTIPTGEWEQTFDFKASAQGWVNYNGFNSPPQDPILGVWTSGLGWLLQVSSHQTDGPKHAVIEYVLPAPITSRRIRAKNSAASTAPSSASIRNVEAYSPEATQLHDIFDIAPGETEGTSNNDQTTTTSYIIHAVSWNHSEENQPNVIIYLESVTIVGVGYNPFSSGQPSPNYRNPFSQVGGTINCIDGSTAIAGVRIPLKKLATQANNNDPTSLQVLIAMSAAVSGITLLAINVNVLTPAVTGAQSDMTPIISATTYVPIVSPNNFETYGGNTQRILLLAKPNGAGNTHLLASTNGGTSWTIKQSNINAQHVHFVEPARGGDGSKCWISGTAGIYYSEDLGATLQNKTGDFATIAGGSASGALQL